MDEPRDPFDKLPDEVLQLIFLAVSDCKSLVRCMAVSKSFRDQSERVSTLSIVCPGEFTSYVDKLQRIYSMVRSFHCLEVLTARVGQPKNEPPSWARCMRYAEIGCSVEKFIFMAAKSGEFSEFDSALRGRTPRKVEAVPDGDDREDTRASSSEDAVDSSQAKSNTVEFSLRQVVAPSNDVLKRMVPVIVFAIVQGLDEFRDSVPDFIRKLASLRSFLLVDMLESVTVFMREHHIQQIRAHQELLETASCSKEAGNQTDGEEERSEMFRHDIRVSECSSDRKGKALDPTAAAEEQPGDRKQKGKELDSAQVSPAETSSGAPSFRSDEAEDDHSQEERSPEPKTEPRWSFPVSTSEDDGRTSSDDNSDAWRHCRGICIHEGEGGRSEFVSKYKRSLKGRDARSMKNSNYRRRERSIDWMDESVRRRQESRWYKGLTTYRRREESRALKNWRLGRRERDGDCEGEGGSSSSSSGVQPSGEVEQQVPLGLGSFGLTMEATEQNPGANHGECEAASPFLRLGDEDQRYYRWGRIDEPPLPLRGGVRMMQREAWREAWRETWGERLGRRARELRREMQNAAAAEMEREGIRRHRLREGVRKRQMEIEREALRFDITFWRAEQVAASSYSLADVSMCIATHSAKPLASRELSALNLSALAGPLLAATIAHVNEQAAFHNL